MAYTLTTGPLHNFGESASDLRAHIAQAGGLQPGALTPNAMVVSQAASPNLTVNVAAGWALVLDSSGGGLYAANVLSAGTGISGGANGHATNPRIDSVILKVNDKVAFGSSVDGGQLLIRQGTATTGATLDNRTGAPTVAASGELLLADMLMPATGTSYTTGNIRDRRRWAKGFNTLIVGNAGGDQSTTSASFSTVPVHTTPRIEVTPGNRIEIVGQVPNTAGASANAFFRVLFGATSSVQFVNPTVTANSVATPIYDNLSGLSGSYVCSLQHTTGAGGTAITTRNTGNFVTRIAVRELLNGNSDNS